MNKKKTLNISQLADYISIPKRTLFDMIRDGRFPIKPIIKSRPRIWSTEQIDNWLRGDKA